MSFTDILKSLMQLISGIGVFLTACGIMSSSLESFGSEKLQSLFSKTQNNKMIGVAIGAVGTAAIQSSGATTVMVIGFVNAGIMSLSQAASVIYGANIGTTITGQIVALGMFGGENTISTTVIFSSLAGIGAFIQSFVKKERLKLFGGILTGFGMLFVGLSLVSGSMNAFAELDSVKVFLAGIVNPILLVLIGTLLTAFVQSSAMITSISIAMLLSGLITLDQGIFITMGSNIGSCVVALLAGLSGSTGAKRASLIHLFFNISGVIFFMIVGGCLSALTSARLSFGVLLGRIFPGVPQTQLAMFHTVFNVTTVVIMLPLTNYLVALVTRLVPEKQIQTETSETFVPRMYYLDDNMLATPPVAIRQLKSEIINMSGTAMHNFSIALNIISEMDYSQLEEFRNNETELNYLNDSIVRFMVKLSNRPLSPHDRIFLSAAFHNVTDIERVGDYAENIIEYADHLNERGERFSAEAIAEIHELEELTERLHAEVITAYIGNDLESLKRAKIIEEEIDDFTDGMAESHIDRLNRGICTPDIGAQYLSLSSDAERIGDHFYNVAKTIVDLI